MKKKEISQKVPCLEKKKKLETNNSNQYTMNVEHSFEQLLSNKEEEVIYVVVNEESSESDQTTPNDIVIRITKKYCEVLKNGSITATMNYENS